MRQAPSTTRRRSLCRLALALCCALLPAACERAQGDLPSAGCEDLVAARAEVEASLEGLEVAVQSLPADAARYPDKTRQALGVLNDHLRDSNARIDAMYDAHEVACKWPLIEDGDFDGVLEHVYLPHVDLVVRQITALQAAADKLDRGAPAEVTGEVVEGYRRAAKLLESGLRAQVEVCETDFSNESCRPYIEAIEARLTGGAAAAPDTAEATPATPAADDESHEDTP